MHISSSVFNQSHNSLQLEGAIVKKAVFIRNQKSNCENARKKSINNHNHLIYWLFSTYSHTAKSPPSAKENCFLICDICKSIFIYINLGLNSKINKLKGETWKKTTKNPHRMFVCVSISIFAQISLWSAYSCLQTLEWTCTGKSITGFDENQTASYNDCHCQQPLLMATIMSPLYCWFLEVAMLFIALFSCIRPHHFSDLNPF